MTTITTEQVDALLGTVEDAEEDIEELRARVIEVEHRLDTQKQCGECMGLFNNEAEFKAHRCPGGGCRDSVDRWGSAGPGLPERTHGEARGELRSQVRELEGHVERLGRSVGELIVQVARLQDVRQCETCLRILGAYNYSEHSCEPSWRDR